MARKLRKYVVPSILGTVGISLLTVSGLYLNETKPVNSNYKFTVSKQEEKVIPVINDVSEIKPLKPYLEDTVGKQKDYYSRSDDEQTQQNSLIYYENTYMPNTGILYSSEEQFDVIASIDGTVKKIGEDNILGKYVELEHENGYKTVYYSLSETAVTEGKIVTKGDVIGISGTNKIEGSLKNNILFETYHEGYLMDPEEFYNIDFSSNQ